MTVMADTTSIELVAKAMAGQAFTKGPEGQTAKAHS